MFFHYQTLFITNAENKPNKRKIFFFVEFLQKNVKLYELRNDLRLDTAGVANFTRRSLADALVTEIFSV